ncbi:hypothetical protein EVAR_38765_1 [Eumeta japonica]|uniref:Uncharacterized protein n=1 Tax=Eumeta variegata TaxID=151549 RepID=A0A4C1WJF9_EUMVA|nr:hypothetical protein EVAR_38765_1 [Eumeta japonica]
MDTRKPEGVTSALPASCEEIDKGAHHAPAQRSAHYRLFCGPHRDSLCPCASTCVPRRRVGHRAKKHQRSNLTKRTEHEMSPMARSRIPIWLYCGGAILWPTWLQHKDGPTRRLDHTLTKYEREVVASAFVFCQAKFIHTGRRRDIQRRRLTGSLFAETSAHLADGYVKILPINADNGARTRSVSAERRKLRGLSSLRWRVSFDADVNGFI